MKIVYVTNDNRMVHDNKFLDKFIEYNHEVHYLSLIKREIKDKEKKEKIKYYGIPVSISDFKKRYPYYLYPFRYIFSLLKLHILLKKVKPDILHGGWIPISGAVSALTGYKPFILMPFGHDVLEFQNFNRFVKMMTILTVNRASRIVVDAEYVKEKLVEFTGCNPEKISVFGWGINRKVFNPHVKSDLRRELGWKDKKIIIMNRGFLKRYDVMTLINSIPNILLSIPEARFLLIGTGDHLNPDSNEIECKRAVIQMKLQKYVRFYSWQPNNELPKFLNSSDIYVTTSLSDGSSVALMEAISCGLPLVVTDVPSFREWVNDGENGYIIPFKDSKSVSESVIKILKNNNLKEKMIKNNLLIASIKADWDINYEVLETVYKSAINE